MLQKLARIVLTVIVVVLAWFYLVPYAMLITSPFSWAEADINTNGFVSPTEASYFVNYGERPYTENGTDCIEYCALKHWIALKKTCR